MKRVIILLILVLFLAGCISVTDKNLKDVIGTLKGEEEVVTSIKEETSLMFDDAKYALNIYNPNVLVRMGETAEIGVAVMNIYSQPSHFDLRVDTEYASVADGVDLEPGEFSVRTVTINAPDEETTFIVHVFLDRGGNNVAAKEVTIKVI